MDSKSLKELRDLITTLRRLGVQQYMTPELTLVLNEDVPASKYRRRQAERAMAVPDLTDEGELSYEDQLFYSATTPINEVQGE